MLAKLKRTPLLLRLALVGILMLVSVETVLWLAFPQGQEPAVRVECWQEFPGLKRDIVYERNGLGLRTLSLHETAKPEGVVRVLCLGASTTDQGTQSTEDMWSAQLEGLLKAELGEGTEIEVATYARGGMKMHETLGWVSRRLESLQPDIVITLFGINELSTEAMFQKRGASFELLRDRVIESSTARAGERIARFSQIWRYGRQVRANSRHSAYLEKNGGLNFDIQGVAAFRKQYWRTPIDNSIPDLPGRTDLFRDLTGYLADWLEEREIRQVILAQPLLLHPGMEYRLEGERIALALDPRFTAPEQIERTRAELAAIWFVVNTGEGMARVTPARFREDMDHFNATQREVAERRGIPYVPLDELLEPNLENFFDDCHFTDLGSRRLAEAILPTVREVVAEVVADR